MSWSVNTGVNTRYTTGAGRARGLLARAASWWARSLRWAYWSLWVLLAVVAFVGWPTQLGGDTGYTVVSGHSMEPTYHTGDLVITRRQATYEVGDVVVYRVPQGEPGAGMFVVHRITGGDATSGFTIQGDNNPSEDIWTPQLRDINGAATIWVPHGGTVLLQTHNPLLWALVGALYVGAILWRDDESDAEPDKAKVLPAV